MRSFSLLRILSALFLLLAGANGYLLADTFGVTSATAEIFSSSATFFCTQSDANSASCAYNGATASAIVNNGTGGAASVSLGLNQLYAGAAANYFLEILGPAGVPVPVIINGTATAVDNADSLGASFANYFVYQNSSAGTLLINEWFGSPAGCPIIIAQGFPCTQSGNFALSETLDSDTIFFVQLLTAAAGTNASSSLDPMITIDPSFPEASEFTVVASQGVYAASPEPVSLALFALGLMAGLLFRRRLSAP
jgi:hypothetical protein